MNRPTVTYMPDLYRFVWSDEGIQVDLERIHEDRNDGVIAEVKIESSRAPTPGLIHQARLNLLSSTTRASMAKNLEARVELDWAGMLEQICYLALKRWREGDPLINLAEVNLDERPRFLVPPLVEYAGPTVLFADGGSGKTTLAKAVAISLATNFPVLGFPPAEMMNVAILDWETDVYTNAAQVRAICAALTPAVNVPPIYYERMTASLAESAPSLRRKFAERQIGFAIVDSLGAARGGEPESADSTIRLFNAGRALGIPWLGVDHVTKSSGDKTRPFGSTYTHNLARMTWSIEKAQEEGSSRLTIALTNHKANNGRLERRRGFHIDYEADDEGMPLTIRFVPCDVRDVPSFLGNLSQKDALVAVMREGNRAMSVEELKSALLSTCGQELSHDGVRTVLNRYKDSLFAQVVDGRTVRWGLLTKALEGKA